MEKSKNITQIIEQQRLGCVVPKQVDVAYNKLKCLSGDNKLFYNSPDEPLYVPVFVSKFCPTKGFEHVLASANEDGKIVLLDSNAPVGKKEIHSFHGHDNAIFDLAWTNNETNLITASGDHSCTLWQIAESDVTPVCQYIGHVHSVKSIACKPDDHSVFASGGRDGAILIWDRRISVHSLALNPDKAIKYSHEGPEFFKRRKCLTQTNSVTGVVFQDDNNLISCSAGGGIIKVWDMRKSYCVSKMKMPQPKYTLHYFGRGRNGFTSLAISPCRLRLYANSIDNYVYCYDIGTYGEKPVAQYGGHTMTSFYIKNSVSPDGRYIASGSGDGKAYIWSIRKPSSPLVTLCGHGAEVTGVDWCKSGHLKMTTCSDDATVRIWQLHPEDYASNDPQLRGWAEEYVDDVHISIKIKTRELTRKRKYSYTKPGHSSDNISQKENTCPSETQDEKRHCSNNRTDNSSLVADLPNFVVDGISPHVHQCSPRPKTQSVNWLSQLKPKSIQICSKSPQQQMQPVTKKKHISSNLSPARGSILRFFKVSSRPSVCEQSNLPSPDTKHTVSSLEA